MIDCGKSIENICVRSMGSQRLCHGRSCEGRAIIVSATHELTTLEKQKGH